MYYYGKKTSELSENQRKERYLTAESRAVELFNENCKKLVGIIPSQEIDKVYRIANIRHRLHTPLELNAKSIYLLESSQHDRLVIDIETINNLLNLPPWNWEEIPTSYDLLYQCEHVDYTGIICEDSYKDWSIQFLTKKLTELDEAAINFLERFDKKYGVRVAPTGFYRGQSI